MPGFRPALCGNMFEPGRTRFATRSGGLIDPGYPGGFHPRLATQIWRSGCTGFCPDPAMTPAAVDRLVHHATIFEMNVESYRRRSALERQSRAGRPPTFATFKSTEEMSRSNNQTGEQRLPALIKAGTT